MCSEIRSHVRPVSPGAGGAGTCDYGRTIALSLELDIDRISSGHG